MTREAPLAEHRINPLNLAEHPQEATASRLLKINVRSVTFCSGHLPDCFLAVWTSLSVNVGRPRRGDNPQRRGDKLELHGLGFAQVLAIDMQGYRPAASKRYRIEIIYRHHVSSVWRPVTVRSAHHLADRAQDG